MTVSQPLPTPDMRLRRISSLFTVFNKFILPGIFVLGFINELFFWGLPPTKTGEAFPPLWLLYILPIPFLAVTLWLGWKLKWVAVDEMNRRIYVSNYRKEISIPFSEIVDVTEFRLSDPTVITIRLNIDTEFGKKIVFLGTYRFGGWLAGPHPIVRELRNLFDLEGYQGR